tara:strand:- start:181 stop:846 length:666 start_codon:yes stop_codon:yes gene_type:complete
MIYSKKQLEAVEIASKDETRYALNGLFLDSNGDTVATDGHLLVRISANGAAPDPELFAIGSDELAQIPDDGVIVPRDVIAKAIKFIPKKKSDPDFRKGVALTKATSGEVELSSDDIDGSDRSSGEPINTGAFPKFKNVIPEYQHNDTFRRVAVNANLLIKLLKLAATGENNQVVIHIPESSLDPFVVTSPQRPEDATEWAFEEVEGVIMPIRGEWNGEALS